MEKPTNELDELAIKYGTDKWGKHHYTPIYYDLFSKKRDKVKKVLEIGVGEGGGLRALRNFFPNAYIWGIDNQSHRIFEEYRIKVFKGDQSNGYDLRRIIAIIGFDIDLVIDDGSHKASDQVFSFLTIMQWLLKGSFYIIEDVAEPEIFSILNRFYECKIEKVGERYDDRLIICQK